MKIRMIAPVLLALFLVSCGGDVGEAEMSLDEQALTELREGYALHYNLHHPSMVADYYTDDAFLLAADGTVNDGREAIETFLEAAMPGSPTISLPGSETMVFGDRAVTMGPYSIEATPADSDPVSFSGSYLTAFSKESGEWKITVAVTNYDSPPPEGWAYAEGGGDPPEEDGTMSDLLGGLVTHWNLGHPSMVADYYTEDVMAAGVNRPITVGREAVAANYAEFMAETSSELTIHDVATQELGEGWALDGGWYQLDAPDGDGPISAGAYLLLCKQAEDGSWQIHWSVVNGQPMAD